MTCTVIVNPTPDAAATPSTQTICSGSTISSITMLGNVSGTQFNWTRDNIAAVTGIANSGTGPTISGTPINTTSAATTVTFNVKPTANGCIGLAITPNVIINPTPKAILSGSAILCGGGGTTTLSLAVTGSGTISGELSDGTPFSGTAPTILVNVSTTTTTTYTISSLTNGTCSALSSDLTGSATVTCPTGIAGIWTGAYDKDWFNCRNWADGNVPTITVSVFIPNTSNLCEIDATASPYAAAFGNVASCKNLTINNNNLSFISLTDTLIDAGDVTIKNDGTINMTTGGKLELQGNWKDSVSTPGKGFKEGIGSVIFSGSATQSISTVTGYNLFTWNNNGGVLLAPEPSYTANSTNYTKSFIATCDNTGAPVNVAGPTTPFGGNAGFQIKNVGNTDTYFPVGASFLPAMTDQVPAPNRMMINSESGTPQDFTVAVNYGDIGYTNGGGGSRRVNRIWYVKSNQLGF